METWMIGTHKRKGRHVLCWVIIAVLAITLWPALSAEGAPMDTSPASLDRVVNGQSLTSEFLTPPQAAKPMVRYWLPEAAVEEAEVRKDIQEIADLGFGGIEIMAYNSGGIFSPSGVTAAYKFATPNWNNLMEIIVDETKKQGLSLDVTNGPRYPIAMPGVASADDPGSSYELTYAKTTMAAGEIYNGIVPQRNTQRTAGTTKLFSAAAYRLTSTKTLDYSSRIDLMADITIDPANNANSSLNWIAPSGSGSWEVLIFFSQPTGQKNGDYFVIDHFGAAGAQACKDYWDSVFQAQPNLRYVSSIFSDSLEYQVDKEWTRDFLTIFQSRKGYDITPYLPAIGDAGYYQTGAGPDYSFTDAGLTQQIKNDYNDVVTWCFNENHLRPLQAMAASYGMNIRYQVAYNKPLGMETSALSVGIPENETLNRGSLDFQRLMASAVHMTGKNILSYETNAEMQNAYNQSFEDIVWWQKRAWATGVSRQVLHGASYSGVWSGGTLSSIFGTFWPGFSGWAGYISNDWNRTTSVEDAAGNMDYIARHNYIMQKKAKIDVAVFRSTYVDKFQSNGADGKDWYPDDGALNSHGYSYEFVSPEILDLNTATVSGGVLNANGPAYKTIVIHNQERISYAAATKLKVMAEAGLPILIVGTIPGKEMYYSDVLAGHTDKHIQDIFKSMLELKNVVRVVDYGDVPDELADNGILPDARYEKTADILAAHHTDGSGEYYYLYNYNKVIQADVTSTRPVAGTAYPGIDKTTAFQAKEAVVTLKGSGRPYLMNAWDGSIQPIAQYEAGNESVTLPLHFAEDEAKLIVLMTDAQASVAGLSPQANSVRAASTLDRIEYEGNKLILKGTKDGLFEMTDGVGQRWNATVSGLQKPFDIAKWTLNIKSLEPGATRFFRDSVWNDLPPITIRTLKPWKDLQSEWSNVSGTGTYTATFQLEKGWTEGGGAYIDLGEVEDSFTVTVNGNRLPFTNQINTRIDIGPYVKAGENVVTVRTSTTLFNRFRTGLSIYSGVAPTGYGLLGSDGKVSIIPYAKVLLTPVKDAEEQAPVVTPVSITAAVTVKVADCTWTGKQIKPTVTVTLGGATLKNGVDYSLTYGANRNIGKGSLTLTGTGTYAGVKTVTFKIVPKKIVLRKVTRIGKGAVKITWKKTAAAQKVTNYQLRYRVKGTTKWTTKTVSPNKVTLTIQKLKKGNVYQFQVRAGKTVSGMKYYGPWSGTKSTRKVY